MTINKLKQEEEEKANLLKKAAKQVLFLEYRVFDRNWVRLNWYDRGGFFLTDTGFESFTISELLNPAIEIRLYRP